MSHISLELISAVYVQHLDSRVNAYNKQYVIIGQTDCKRYHIYLVIRKFLNTNPDFIPQIIEVVSPEYINISP